MSNGMSWSRPNRKQVGAAQGASQPAQFPRPQGFGAPANPQFQNPFQQARAAPEDSQPWYSGANGASFGGAAPAQSPFSSFPQSQFSSGSAFAAAAAAQPFAGTGASAGAGAFAGVGTGTTGPPQVFGQPQTTNTQGLAFPQAPLHPQSAFSSVPSSVAPAPVNMSVPVREQEPKSNQKSKKSGRNAKDEAGPKPRPTSAQPPQHQHAGSKFPEFAPASFPERSYPQSNDLAILKPLPKPLTNLQERRDLWDAENQQKLESIEREYLQGLRSLQDAYDLMSSMREKERNEMEKRGLVDSVQARKSLDDAIVFVGSCLDMCPVYERVRRALENNVMSLERNDAGQVVGSRAVKAFARPAAGNPPALPSDVRPPSVLVNTLRYLVNEIVPNLPDCHAFLWDRTRSIRQDFTFQNFQGPEATWCFEVIARIHIVSLHIMASAAASGTEWSQQQELEQFNKCLQSLYEFYQQTPTDNEAEMRAYGLLSHLFDEEMAATVDRLPLQVSRHPLVALALELRALATTSVTEFFVRLRKPDVPPLFRAVLEIHFNVLRRRGVSNLASSLHRRSNMYPFKRFASLLGFENVEQAQQFCEFYDLTVSTSSEAGEEIDFKAWNEESVRDKRPMAQSFDLSLDLAIKRVRVDEPLQLSPNTLSTPTATVSRLLEQQKPKFNFSAPAFQPSQNIAATQPTSLADTASESHPAVKASGLLSTQSPPISTQDLPGTKSSSLHGAEAQPNYQPGVKLPITTGPSKSALSTNAQKGAVTFPSIPKPAPTSGVPEPAAFKRKDFQSNEPAGPRVENKPAESKKPAVAESVIENIYADSVHAETQKVLDHVSRAIERRNFVDATANTILKSLLTSVVVRDSDDVVKAVEYDRLRLKRLVARSVKNAAADSLMRKREHEKQKEELQMFWNRAPSRVVSLKRSRAPSSTHLQSSAEVDVSFSEKPDECKPASQKEIESERVEEDGDDDTAGEIEPFSFLPLAPLMRKAYSGGLTRLAVLVDPQSRQGLWLHAVLGVGTVPVEVLPGRVLTVHVVGNAAGVHDFDVVLYGEGTVYPKTVVTRNIAGIGTLTELEKAFASAIRDWLTWHERDLLKYRSLNIVNIKRRRISHPSSSLDSKADLSLDTLASAQHSFAAESNQRARLRALVAGAKSLMS